MNSGEEVELLHLGDVTPAWESQTQPWMMLPPHLPTDQVRLHFEAHPSVQTFRRILSQRLHQIACAGVGKLLLVPDPPCQSPQRHGQGLEGIVPCGEWMGECQLLHPRERCFRTSRWTAVMIPHQIPLRGCGIQNFPWKRFGWVIYCQDPWHQHPAT